MRTERPFFVSGLAIKMFTEPDAIRESYRRSTPSSFLKLGV